MEVNVRKVKREDWDFILELRNKPKFRKFFYNQNEISKDEHYNYLEIQEKNLKFFNWIVCYGSKNIGYARVLENDVSIMIDDNYQGKGIGQKTLRLIEKEMKEKGIKKLVGRIMIENISSKKIFERNDYKLKMYWYEKNLN